MLLLFLFIEFILLLTPNAVKSPHLFVQKKRGSEFQVHCESTEDLGLGDEEKVDEFDATGCGLTKG
jgi:hypothetical protein